MAAKDVLGRAGEDRATEYLRGLGYAILDRNWRCNQGEIDVVAFDGAETAFVEVKTRSGKTFKEKNGIARGYPEAPMSDADIRAKFDRLAGAIADAPTLF